MNNELREILTILQEECAEVIVEISKCFRFGPDQILKGTSDSNIERLQKELGDLQAMIDLLIDANIGISTEGIKLAKNKKFEKLKTWSNLQINK